MLGCIKQMPHTTFILTLAGVYISNYTHDRQQKTRTPTKRF